MINALIVIVVIFIAILIFNRTKLGEKFSSGLEPTTFLRGFQMIHDFQLIQEWNANDFPVIIGRWMGSLVKQKTYAAVGEKNGKTYLIIKQLGQGLTAFNTQYIYLEKSSIDKLKSIFS